MTRYKGYVSDKLPDIIARLNKGQWIIRDEKIEKEVSKYEISYSQSDQWEFTVCLKEKGEIGKYKMTEMFCFAQMDANCGALTANCLTPRLVTDSTKEVIIRNTFILKNIASYLGDNYILTSHYSDFDSTFESAGWKTFDTVESNRGGYNKISYYGLSIPKEQMVTKGFTYMSNPTLIPK